MWKLLLERNRRSIFALWYLHHKRELIHAVFIHPCILTYLHPYIHPRIHPSIHPSIHSYIHANFFSIHDSFGPRMPMCVIHSHTITSYVCLCAVCRSTSTAAIGWMQLKAPFCRLKNESRNRCVLVSILYETLYEGYVCCGRNRRIGAMIIGWRDCMNDAIAIPMVVNLKAKRRLSVRRSINALFIGGKSYIFSKSIIPFFLCSFPSLSGTRIHNIIAVSLLSSGGRNGLSASPNRSISISTYTCTEHQFLIHIYTLPSIHTYTYMLNL